MSIYESDVQLGRRYRDRQTGLTGVATAAHFYQHACERITLEYLNGDQDVQEVTFDAPRLDNAYDGQPVTATRPGGPARAGETRTVATR